MPDHFFLWFCTNATFLFLCVFAAVRENRTRGGRNKFGPIYRRDRALRRQMQMQRLHSEGLVAGSYLNDKLFIHDFQSLSPNIDVKPTAAELAALASQSPSSSALHTHKDHDFLFSRRQIWRDAHHGGGVCSAGEDFPETCFPLLGRHTGGTNMVDPVTQRSIDDMAAAAAADTFNRRTAASQDQTSQPSLFHRQQTYQTSGDGWQYPSATSVPSYNFVQHSPCESSRPIAVNYSPGIFQNFRSSSECLTKAPGETTETSPRCRYAHSADLSSPHRQYATSNAVVSQYRTGASHEPSLHAFHHHRHRRHHHPQYSHYYHHHHQQLRSNQPQPQPQLSSSLPQSPEVKQSQPDEQVVTSDGTSAEFVSEADIAAQRLPGTLKLINDLQRHDPRLRDSVDQLRCYADELLEQLQNCMLGNGGENGVELNGAATMTQQMIVMGCQLCDQALFVLVEWARHAHFFRQLSVSKQLLQSIISCI